MKSLTIDQINKLRELIQDELSRRPSTCDSAMLDKAPFKAIDDILADMLGALPDRESFEKHNTKTVIKSNLITLTEDCQIQADTLRVRLDVSWDVHDISNW